MFQPFAWGNRREEAGGAALSGLPRGRAGLLPQGRGLSADARGRHSQQSLVERHPWVAERVYTAFAKAKEIAIANFEKLSAFAITLPWIEAEYRATQAVLGEDIWPYGVAANAGAIDTLCRYLHEQGFTRRRMGIAELFAPMAAAHQETKS
jgi:hypothetical protein